MIRPVQTDGLFRRRSKPAFPMTYTARATLEIGSGSVSSGRATTTTTASNQVRTFSRTPRTTRSRRIQHLPDHPPALTFGPPERLYQTKLYKPSQNFFMKPRFLIHRKTDWTTDEIVKNCDTSSNVINTVDLDNDVSPANSIGMKSFENIQEDNTRDDEGEVPIMLEDLDPKQCKLLSALIPKTEFDKASDSGGGSKCNRDQMTAQTKRAGRTDKKKGTRDSNENKNRTDTEKLKPIKENLEGFAEASSSKLDSEMETEMWTKQVGSWYDSFFTNYVVDTLEKDAEYDCPLNLYQTPLEHAEATHCAQRTMRSTCQQDIKKYQNNTINSKSQHKHQYKNVSAGFQNISSIVNSCSYSDTNSAINFPYTSNNHMIRMSINNNQKRKDVCSYDYKNLDYQSDYRTTVTANKYNRSFEYVHDDELSKLRKQYRASVGNNLVAPKLSFNPKNVRSMTIGKPVSFDNDNGTNQLVTDTNLNNSCSKCDNVLEDIRAMEIMNSSVRTCTPDSLQDNTIIKESDNKPKIVTYLNNDICYGSQPNSFDGFMEQTQQKTSINEQEVIKTYQEVTLPSKDRNTVIEEKPMCSYDKEIELTDFQVAQTNQEDIPKEIEMFDFSFRYKDNRLSETEIDLKLVDLYSKQTITDSNEVDVKEISSERRQQDNIRYFADQQKLFNVLEISNVDNSDKEHSFTFLDDKKEIVQIYLRTNQTVAEPVNVKEINLDDSEVIYTENNQIQPPYVEELKMDQFSNTPVKSAEDVNQISTSEIVSNEPYVIPNDTSHFLTLPKHLVSTVSAPQLQIENYVDFPVEKLKQKKDNFVNNNNKNAVKKTALKALLLEQLFKVVGKGTVANNEVGLPNN